MEEKRDTTTTSIGMSDLSKRVDQIEEFLEQSQQQSAKQYSGIMAAIARLTEKAQDIG